MITKDELVKRVESEITVLSQGINRDTPHYQQFLTMIESLMSLVIGTTYDIMMEQLDVEVSTRTAVLFERIEPIKEIKRLNEKNAELEAEVQRFKELAEPGGGL